MAKKGKSPNFSVRLRKGTKGQKKAHAKKEAARLTVPGSFNLVARAWRVLSKNWQILGGIFLIYILLNIVLANGLGAAINNFNSVKSELGAAHSFSDALNSFSSLLGSSTGAGSEAASVMQSILLVLASLVIIWALRQLLAKKKFSLKDAYYKSTYPLVPFLLIVLIIFVQLLPITLGSGLVALVSSTLSSGGAATLVMFAAILPLFAWSLYMLSSSIFALYIVTLPDMQPRQALRAAKKLVQFRRLKIIRRILFLPLFILLVIAAIVLPLILFANFLVAPVFYTLSLLAVLLAHTYLYSLYRGLLDG